MMSDPFSNSQRGKEGEEEIVIDRPLSLSLFLFRHNAMGFDPHADQTNISIMI